MEGTSNPIRDPRVAVAPEVQVDFHNTFASFTNAVLALVRGSFVCRTRTRTNTNPNDTEANAAGRSVRACVARKSKS